MHFYFKTTVSLSRGTEDAAVARRYRFGYMALCVVQHASGSCDRSNGGADRRLCASTMASAVAFLDALASSAFPVHQFLQLSDWK